MRALMARAHDHFEISYFELTLMDGVSLEANVGCITLSKIITPQFLEKSSISSVFLSTSGFCTFLSGLWVWSIVFIVKWLQRVLLIFIRLMGNYNVKRLFLMNVAHPKCNEKGARAKKSYDNEPLDCTIYRPQTRSSGECLHTRVLNFTNSRLTIFSALIISFSWKWRHY